METELNTLEAASDFLVGDIDADAYLKAGQNENSTLLEPQEEKEEKRRGAGGFGGGRRLGRGVLSTLRNRREYG